MSSDFSTIEQSISKALITIFSLVFCLQSFAADNPANSAILAAYSSDTVKTKIQEEPDIFRDERKNMVDEQIAARGIDDAHTLQSMLKVRRDLFVPYKQRQHAYEDRPLPIGYGQTISQPYIVAYMTEKLSLKPEHKVLEIGSGSGYQAAILAEIVKEVYTVEIIPELGAAAEKRLKDLKYANVKAKVGDGYYGWKEHAPFDRIIVTAAAGHIPQPLLKQLKDGGIMIIPVGSFLFSQYLIMIKKNGSKIVTEKLLPVRFVPLTGKRSDDQ